MSIPKLGRIDGLLRQAPTLFGFAGLGFVYTSPAEILIIKVPCPFFS